MLPLLRPLLQLLVAVGMASAWPSAVVVHSVLQADLAKQGWPQLPRLACLSCEEHGNRCAGMGAKQSSLASFKNVFYGRVIFVQHDSRLCADSVPIAI